MRWMVRQGPSEGGGSPTPAPAEPTSSVLQLPPVECTVEALVDLDAAGAVVQVPATVRDAEGLARHLHVAVAAIAATAVLRTRGGQHLFVISSAAHPLFLPSLAAVLCEPELFRDEAADVLRRTGSVLGSASPLSLSEPLPTYVDVALAPHQDIWVPAGHPHAVFRTRYDELLRLTG